MLANDSSSVPMVRIVCHAGPKAVKPFGERGAADGKAIQPLRADAVADLRQFLIRAVQEFTPGKIVAFCLDTDCGKVKCLQNWFASLNHPAVMSFLCHSGARLHDTRDRWRNQVTIWQPRRYHSSKSTKPCLGTNSWHLALISSKLNPLFLRSMR